MPMHTKQILVIRKDLGMRKGKFCSAAAHASIGAYKAAVIRWAASYLSPLEIWEEDGTRKITVYVNSEQEILELQRKAIELDLPCHLVTDEGLTEFHGVKTITALGIGPCLSMDIDPITEKLPLL